MPRQSSSLQLRWWRHHCKRTVRGYLANEMHTTGRWAYYHLCSKRVTRVFPEICLPVVARIGFSTSLAVMRRFFLSIALCTYVLQASYCERSFPWRLFVLNEFLNLETTLYSILNSMVTSFFSPSFQFFQYCVHACVKAFTVSREDIPKISYSSIDSFPLNFTSVNTVKLVITVISAITWRTSSAMWNLHTHNTLYCILH